MQQRLQRQPLRGEAVQRRQAGDRHRADEERAARPGHPAQQAAEPVELERADRALERARAEEEQRLEDRVVERVQQRGGERERRPGVGAARAQHQAGAEAEHDDPDVLDRVQREQPLEVVLEERVDDAADRRERADREHEHAEPERQHAEPVDEHAHEPVDRDLDHHAAHQRRHGRGRDRMRARQPDVQRHHARLRPHADERGQRDRDLQARARSDRRRAADRAGVREQQDRDPRAGAAEMRHGQVGEDRAARGRSSERATRIIAAGSSVISSQPGEERQRVARAEHLGEREHERRRSARRSPRPAAVGSR